MIYIWSWITILLDDDVVNQAIVDADADVDGHTKKDGALHDKTVDGSYRHCGWYGNFDNNEKYRLILLLIV